MSTIWHTQGDSGVCPSCRALDGQRDLVVGYGSDPKIPLLPPHPACTSPSGCRCRIELDSQREVVHAISGARFGEWLTACGRFAAILTTGPTANVTCPSCIEAIRNSARLADLRETYGHTVEPVESKFSANNLVAADPAIPVERACLFCHAVDAGGYETEDGIGPFCDDCFDHLRSYFERAAFDAGFVLGIDAKIPLFPYGTLATRIFDARKAAYDRWLVEREKEPK